MSEASINNYLTKKRSHLTDKSILSVLVYLMNDFYVKIFFVKRNITKNTEQRELLVKRQLIIFNKFFF